MQWGTCVSRYHVVTIAHNELTLCGVCISVKISFFPSGQAGVIGIGTGGDDEPCCGATPRSERPGSVCPWLPGWREGRCLRGARLHLRRMQQPAPAGAGGWLRQPLADAFGFLT